MEYDGGDNGGYGDGGSGHGFGHRGVSSFHDIFTGIELAATLTGHSVSLADAAAASLIIGVALDHGSGFEFSSLPTGYAQDVFQGPGPRGPDGPTAYVVDPGRELNLPGIARSATTVEVLYWPHGRCEPRREIQQLAASVGLERYSRPAHHPLWEETLKTRPRILTGFPLGTPEERHKLPNGWYRDEKGTPVTGTTHSWLEFYRIRPTPSSVRELQRAFYVFTAPEDVHRTFLVVTGATWHYHHKEPYWLCDDYETRVVFSIYSGILGDGAGYTYRWDQIRQHRQAACHLAKLLHDYLKAHPPSPSSVQFRRDLDPILTRPTRQAPADEIAKAVDPVVANIVKQIPWSPKEPGWRPAFCLRVTEEAATDDHNEPGLRIHVTYPESRPVGSEWFIEAFFYRQDGTPLRDSDGQFTTREGQVGVGLFSLLQQEHRENNPPLEDVLFIPYAQLHLGWGRGLHNLKYHVEITDPRKGKLAHSADRSFSLSPGLGNYVFSRPHRPF